MPAGGSVEAEVYADAPGPSMAIGPTKFTIPGLWAGLQDKIYGESKEIMKYEEKAKKNINQIDIDNGIKIIRGGLLEKAKKEVAKDYSDYDQLVYRIDENSVSFDIDGKVGEEKNEFSITMTAEVAVVAFNNNAVQKMAEKKLISLIASDKELIEFNKDNITYSLDNYNLSQGTATVNANFEGMTTITSAADIIDREKIVGLTRDQLDVYLNDIQQIKSFEVNFSPAFIDKVPDLADQIKIKVKN